MNFAAVAADWLVPAILAVVAVLLLAILLLIVSLNRKMRQMDAFISKKLPDLLTDAVARSALVSPRKEIGRAGVTGGRPGLQGDLDRLAGDHKLDAYTVSTRDGLLVASTSSKGLEDAAYFSELFRNGTEISEPRVQVFPIAHGSDNLVGIIRSEKRRGADEIGRISERTQVALSRWV